MPSEALQESKIARLIHEGLLDAELIDKGNSEQTMKAHELLKEMGIEAKPEQMIKAMVCIPVENGKYITERALVALVPGPSKVSLVKLAKAAGYDKIVIADQVTAEKLSGFPRGGTPPVGHNASLKVFLDSSFTKFDVLFGGGGETIKIIKISPKEIKKFTEHEGREYKEEDIKE